MSDLRLSTGRLILRSPVREDATRIAVLANDRDVARMTTRMPHPYTLKDAHDFVARVQSRHDADAATFLIEVAGSGPAGLIGFFLDDGARWPEIGYWLGRPFWGQGYATEAAGAAVDWAHGAWGKAVVVSGHFHDNAASGGVLCKAGFLYTGVVERRFSRARNAHVDTRMLVRLA